jgi:RNA polymerase sigma-70 factor (ECF subfamily)
LNGDLSQHPGQLSPGIRDFDDPIDRVSKMVETKVEHERMKRGLHLLGPLQRQELTVAYSHGLTVAEIADKFGVSKSTVKT